MHCLLLRGREREREGEFGEEEQVLLAVEQKVVAEVLTVEQRESGEELRSFVVEWRVELLQVAEWVQLRYYYSALPGHQSHQFAAVELAKEGYVQHSSHDRLHRCLQSCHHFLASLAHQYLHHLLQFQSPSAHLQLSYT